MPPLELACPFCQSRHVEALASEGRDGHLTRLQCQDCRKTWSENLAARTRDKLKARGLAPNARPLVLNVDDRAASLYARDRILRLHGFDVANASTGHSALNMAERLQPSLILLDAHLPDINGAAVCARLKSRAATAGIPVVLISGAPTGDVPEIDGAGAARVLAEPVDADALASTLREVLGGAS